MTPNGTVDVRGGPGGRGRRLVTLVIGPACVAMTLATHVPLPRAAEPPRPTADDSLARREAELERQYRDLERSLLRLADLLADTDPRRATVLRDAFQQAREAELGDRLGRIVALLEDGQLLAAGTGQEQAVERFRGLLELLEEGGRERNLSDTRDDVRRFLSQVGRLIARQRELEAATETGGQAETLAGRQRQVGDDAADLAQEVGDFAKRIDESPAGGRRGRREADGTEPADGPATDEPGDPARDPETGREGRDAGGGRSAEGGSDGAEQDPEHARDERPVADATEEPAGDDEVSRARRTRRRLEAAERRMRSAEERLSAAEPKPAREAQQKAIEELETARAELERILRQMREEEVERLLVQLEARVRTMLKAEREIVVALGRLADDEAPARRERELEAARIGREQETVTADADRALTLVRDDGSAVAVPEALGQVRDDSAQLASRLGRGDLAPATTAIATEIVTGLEELLAALEKSRREGEERRQQAGPGGGRPAEPGEQPLVDRLAELKMLRSLQARVNARTERLATLLDEGEDDAGADVTAALGRLAERQRAIERAARDIVTGRAEP